MKKPKRVIKTPYHARQRQPKELDVVPSRNDEPATPVRAALPSPANDVVEPQLTEKEKQDILKYVETEAPEVEALDEATLKRMILLFEKRALRNQEMRVKFPDQPEKYVNAWKLNVRWMKISMYNCFWSFGVFTDLWNPK